MRFDFLFNLLWWRSNRSKLNSIATQKSHWVTLTLTIYVDDDKVTFVFRFFVLGIFRICGLVLCQPLKLTAWWKEPFCLQFLLGGYMNSFQQECSTSQICASLWSNSHLFIMWTRKRLLPMIIETIMYISCSLMSLIKRMELRRSYSMHCDVVSLVLRIVR